VLLSLICYLLFFDDGGTCVPISSLLTFVSTVLNYSGGESHLNLEGHTTMGSVGLSHVAMPTKTLVVDQRGT